MIFRTFSKPLKCGHFVVYQDRFPPRCVACVRARNKAYAKKRRLEAPEIVKANSRATYARLRADPARLAKERTRQREVDGLPAPTRPSPTRCESCGNKPSKYALHLDHDHVTGAFRGWLCTSCNLGIGQLGDSIAGLELALSYLKRAPQ